MMFEKALRDALDQAMPKDLSEKQFEDVCDSFSLVLAEEFARYRPDPVDRAMAVGDFIRCLLFWTTYAADPSLLEKRHKEVRQ